MYFCPPALYCTRILGVGTKYTLFLEHGKIKMCSSLYFKLKEQYHSSFSKIPLKSGLQKEVVTEGILSFVAKDFKRFFPSYYESFEKNVSKKKKINGQYTLY